MPQTIEQTSKKYKVAQLLSVVFICIGVVMIMVGSSDSLFMFILGLCLYAYGRIGAWWNNG